MRRKQDTRIAILVPTYNSSRTVGQTLRSILDQGESVKAVNVYIADDHSSDDTLKVVTATWNSTVPLQVLANKINCGERKNSNGAIELIGSEHDWIRIVHSE